MSVVRNFSWLWALALLLAGGAAQARGGLPDFTDLVERASPAVVNISTTQKVKSGRPKLPHGWKMPDLPEDNPLGDLFRHFFEEGEGPAERDAKSLGSGFIISPDGYVITNNHVIADADEIIVRLSDRRELKAQVVGSDERSDVALLKIESDKRLPVVKIGKSEHLKPGEWVLAIGTPFGFDHSVTAGIVSAKGRSLPNENYVPFIQTDVAINPGNSGGPLFNMDGEVVGVNSQIYSRTGGYMGLSFSIPIEMAMDVVAQLKASGKVSRGWLGVLIQDVTRELAESFGMDQPRGALVSKILPGSPAEKAGFQVGDIIIRFDGREVERSGALPPMVGRTKVGSKVKVVVVRNGRDTALTVHLEELPEDDELQLAEGGPAAQAPSRLGVAVTDPTPEQREELGLEENEGVVVTRVTDGPAARAGIRDGDLIQMLNNIRVRDAGHFAKLVDELPEGKPVPVLIQRRGGPVFLALKLEKE